ncbi:MAG TPA: tannase/feruloyl esterase family alpha/beta hydrolase [Steroidobacteraceae bacterium]|nr:tannase/feruloyl esterase family alpha/beta hydrolase [Steroidobacteraceae bacterium]
MRVSATATTIFATFLGVALANAQSQNAAEPATSRCAALQSVDFARVSEAPTHIAKTALVEAKDEVPAYCLIEGAVTATVGFVLKLPATNWNGRFFEAGCGNYCGVVFPKACDAPLRKGYACIATDSGHRAPADDVFWTDGKWASNNLQAELDWGGRATHVTALAGKAITDSFYGKPPLKSYFMGCSYGGHQAMVLAQRFPWDFDGIVGGGAPNRISDLMQQNAWAITTAFDSHLNSVFSEADIRILHNAALAKCDLDDGVKDGLIGNPRSCKVDVDQLVCRSARAKACLSPDIAAIAKKMYSGPTNSRGERLTAGGWTPGSEPDWRLIYNSNGTGLVALAENYFRYMGRLPELGPDWQTRDYDFDRDYKRNDVMETLYAADNPDLRRFKAAGGKFINYVGWSDLGTLPGVAIDYYETAEKTMGGRAATQDFFRMFVIPGARHCRGGEGASDIDFLSYIEAWVERGKAPDVMIGSHPNQAGGAAFTRPMYPYPLQAIYKGSGDPNDAANYKAGKLR